MKTSLLVLLAIGASLFLAFCNSTSQPIAIEAPDNHKTTPLPSATVIDDSLASDNKILALANGDSTGRWPVKGPGQLAGAILPHKRIVSYYGNLYSAHMGILGQLPKAQMLEKLAGEVALWNEADAATPAVPALHYVAVTAQASPGRDGKYRQKMPDEQVDTVISWAREINGLTFLDIQTGHSTVAAEVPRFEKYLLMPDVHLGIDPEYSMKNGGVPGSSIGSFDAADINDAIDYLAKLVRTHNLPPKMLVVHRFTMPMVTNYQSIRLVPEVQVIMDMDGFGSKSLKLDSYKACIFQQPVQFAGFKLFYKYDKNKGRSNLYSPAELMTFTPIPIYIQYQ